jgi:hypothetical protein
MAKPAKSRLTKKPVWERGYYAHGYWSGKVKLGSVKLGKKGEWDGVYRWQGGKHMGEAATLAQAKQAVEQAVLLGTRQLQLFQDEGG